MGSSKNSITAEFLTTEHLLRIEKNNASHIADIQGFVQDCFIQKRAIQVNTSGSTGTPKTIELSYSTILGSAKRTIEFFGLEEGHNLLIALPTSSIATKMMAMRTVLCKGNLIYITPSSNPLLALPKKSIPVNFAAFTPMQVFEIIKNKKSLAQFNEIEKVIIGGGVISTNLEAALKKCKPTIYATYGMTETASHVATRKVNVSRSYVTLPGINIRQGNNNQAIIETPETESPIVTNDIIELNADGSFEFKGRLDHIINSGGVKINIDELENSLAQHISQPFLIASTPDNQLGEAITLFTDTSLNTNQLHEATEGLENKKSHPKAWVRLKNFKLTSTGKVDRINSIKENNWLEKKNL